MISETLLKTNLLNSSKFDLKHIQWMNKKASPKEAYKPTTIEHIANIITHGMWIFPSILAGFELLKRSHSSAQFFAGLVYGGTLVFLFGVSTSFHCIFYCNRNRQLKDVLHRCDRAMIYIFIAGSYFPWLTIEPLPQESWASSMRWIVWLFALLGISYQQTFHEKYKQLETVFYLLMGIGPSLLIALHHNISGIKEIVTGGLFYLLGVIFFKLDGVVPLAHAIWHLFVVLAAGVHYFAILHYLYPFLMTG